VLPGIKKNSERFCFTFNPPFSRDEAKLFAATLILPFCEEVFSRPEPDWRIPESVYSKGADPRSKSGSSVTLANEADRSNILAPGLRSETFRTHLSPAFTAGAGDTPASTTIGSWEIVSSYSSATAPALHRISRADPLD